MNAGVEPQGFDEHRETEDLTFIPWSIHTHAWQGFGQLGARTDMHNCAIKCISGGYLIIFRTHVYISRIYFTQLIMCIFLSYFIKQYMKNISTTVMTTKNE